MAILVASTAGASTIYTEDFESGAPGFTYSSLWHVTANAPFAGSFALGFVKDETAGSTPDGSYADTGGIEFAAFSPLIALPAGPVSLSFVARVDDELGDEPDDFDRLSVGVSLDGSTFDSVLASSNPQNGGVNIPENVGYNPFLVDLSAYAGQSVFLAFSFNTFDNIDDIHPGPRVDNLQVTTGAPIPEPATLTLLGLGVLPVLRRRLRRR